MKLFIDTANLNHINELVTYNIISGVTTNPSLMAKEGISGKENCFKRYIDICDLVDGPVSAEVISTDLKGMLNEAYELNALHPNIVIKIPMIKEKTYILKLRRTRVIMSKEIIAIIHIDTVCKIELLAKLANSPK